MADLQTAPAPTAEPTTVAPAPETESIESESFSARELLDDLPLPGDLPSGEFENDLFPPELILTDSPMTFSGERLLTDFHLTPDSTGQDLFNALYNGPGNHDYAQTYRVALETYGMSASDVENLITREHRSQPLHALLPITVPATMEVPTESTPVREVPTVETPGATLAALEAMGITNESTVRDVYTHIYRTTGNRSDAQTYTLMRDHLGLDTASLEASFDKKITTVVASSLLEALPTAAIAGKPDPTTGNTMLTGQQIIDKYFYAARLLGSPSENQWNDAATLAKADGIELGDAARNRAGNFTVLRIENGRSIADRFASQGFDFRPSSPAPSTARPQHKAIADEVVKTVRNEGTNSSLVRKETTTYRAADTQESTSPIATRETRHFLGIPVYTETRDAEGGTSRRVLGFIPLPGSGIDRAATNTINQVRDAERVFRGKR